jgi:carboxypeptidase family protein
VRAGERAYEEDSTRGSGLSFLLRNRDPGANRDRLGQRDGERLVDAKVRALEINTRSAQVTTTNDVGFYSFSQLKPGDYEVSVEIPAFARFASRVRVSVGTLTTVDAVLSLAQVDTNTTVIGDGGVQVETQSRMLSDVVNSQQILQSPTLRRNPCDLVSLAGNISPGDPGGRGVGVAINGQRRHFAGWRGKHRCFRGWSGSGRTA